MTSAAVVVVAVAAYRAMSCSYASKQTNSKQQGNGDDKDGRPLSLSPAFAVFLVRAVGHLLPATSALLFHTG